VPKVQPEPRYPIICTGLSTFGVTEAEASHLLTSSRFPPEGPYILLRLEPMPCIGFEGLCD